MKLLNLVCSVLQGAGMRLAVIDGRVRAISISRVCTRED